MQHEVEDVFVYTGQRDVPTTVRRVKIAENITRIIDEAFRKHPELEEVTLSSSVREIGKSAFRGCKKLKFIFHEGVRQEKKIGIPSTVKVIDGFAFCECKSLESLCLNEGLEQIGECAFEKCEGLTKVDIPSTVKVIDDDAFFECIRLESLNLNEGLERIGKAAFGKCEGLTKVDIPSTVTVIDDIAFFECEGLESLHLNEGLERIGEGAFQRCEGLTKVDIPSTVRVIDDGAFLGCEGLESLNLNEGLERIGEAAFHRCGSLMKVDIPSTVKVIDDSAFGECEGLKSLNLNEGLERIGKRAFNGCECLTKVEIPSTVKEIVYGTFQECNSLKNVQLLATLKRIEANAFDGCLSLNCVQFVSEGSLETSLSYPNLEDGTIIFPDKAELQIGNYAFRKCDSLLKVIVASKSTKLGVGVFCGCRRLFSVQLAEGLQAIEERLFENWRSVSHIRIPSSVESIAENAFLECRSLVSIEIPEETALGIDLSGCKSLVNVAGPISTIIPEDFFQDSMLGRVVQDKTDLDRRLNHRFDNSPLNKLCYYQSYHSLEDAMIQLHSLMEDDPLRATIQVDEFDMTPLHVLSLSQTPNLDVLVALMKAGHLDHVIHGRDSFGSTPMDYLCLNRMSTSTKVIRRVLHTRFDHLLGLNRLWKSDMLRSVDAALAVDWSCRRREIVAVYLKLAMYERKEIFSLIELYLWKIQIDEIRCKKEQIGDRESCRISCGASVVLPLLLPFLDKLEEGDYSFHSP